LTGENFGYAIWSKKRVKELSAYSSKPINFGETEISVGSEPDSTGFQHFWTLEGGTKGEAGWVGNKVYSSEILEWYARTIAANQSLNAQF